MVCSLHFTQFLQIEFVHISYFSLFFLHTPLDIMSIFS